MGWNVNPLITVIIDVQGIVHKQSLKALEKLKNTPKKSEKLMKYIHQIAIKYLTYLVLN